MNDNEEQRDHEQIRAAIQNSMNERYANGN